MYSGVSFDAEGNPLAPSKLEADQRFDSDGTPYVGAGTTIRVDGRVRGMSADGELRVIFAIEEPRRVGFALGTVGGLGRQRRRVLHRASGTTTTRCGSRCARSTRPTALLYRVFPALVRRRRRELFTRYLRAISPLYATPA